MISNHRSLSVSFLLFGLFFFFFFFLSPALSLSFTHPQDLQALKAFKAAIDPSSIPSWSCLASWDFTAADPCDPSRRTNFLCGLTCSPSNSSSFHYRVDSIALDSAGYRGTPLSPYLLSNLVRLDLSDNAFHGPIPFSSGGPSCCLQSLYLRANRFSGPLSPAIGKLRSLQDLDLSRNLLSGSIPDTISSLSLLTRLDLSTNNFTGSVPKLPSSLIELAIRSNSLSGPLPQPSFSESTRLQVIDLSSNFLSGPLLYWFFNLPSLQQVNLSNNTLTRVEVHQPTTGRGLGGGGQHLVAVDLGYNEIHGSLPVNFSTYPSLWALSLRHNRLRGQIPRQYGAKKSNLKRLFLDGNFLIGKPPPEFFSGRGAAVSDGSFGDNCLMECPSTSRLCLPLQKPVSVCRQVYRGKGL